MQEDIVQVIEKYISNIINDKFHRFKSWDNCFQTFATDTKSDSHSLALGFFLASWECIEDQVVYSKKII